MDKIKRLRRNFGFWLSRRINYPLVPPDTLQISLTSRCNLTCQMCSVWDGANMEDELTFDEIKSAIDQSKKWGILEINLCGGEPLLRQECFEIIKYAKSLCIRVILTSNGTLINDDMAQRLFDSNLDILTISLDGAEASTHDKIRGQPGSFDKIISGIKYLNSHKNSSRLVKVLILTISNYNLDELEDYFHMAESLSIDALYLTSLVLDNVKLYEQDCAGTQNEMWIAGDRLNKLDEMIDKIMVLQKKRYGLNYPSFPLIKKYFRRQVTAKDWVCFAGFRRFVLVPGGIVQMCGETIGNIRETASLRKIWASKKAGEKRRQIKKCRNYCLQDCHARQESANLRNVLEFSFKENK